MESTLTVRTATKCYFKPKYHQSEPVFCRLSDLLSSPVEWYKEIRVLTYYMYGFTENICTLSKNQIQISTYHRLSVKEKWAGALPKDCEVSLHFRSEVLTVLWHRQACNSLNKERFGECCCLTLQRRRAFQLPSKQWH